MSILNRTQSEFERHSVDDPYTPPPCVENNKAISAATKRVFYRKRILPKEIFDDLPESSVDPPQGRCGGVTQRILPAEGFFSKRSIGRAITVIGSPVHKLANRSKSVDFSRRYNGNSLPHGNGENVNLLPEEKYTPTPSRSLVCQECSGGTFFGVYHTPTGSRKTFDSLPSNSSPPDHQLHWERPSLPPLSTFASPPQTTFVTTTQATFHYTPELRYKPVYFGDPRQRRYSHGYNVERKRPSAGDIGLQNFCRTMLAAKRPDMPPVTDYNIREKCYEKNETPDKVDTLPRDVHPHKKGQSTTPLRSPKMVKEVLKRMSSHPSGRDPQVADTSFSDEEDIDFYVEKEALKVIDAFEMSLCDAPSERALVSNKKHQDPAPRVSQDGVARDQCLVQSDNLVEEEVLLSERRPKEQATMPYSSEKYLGREEIEEYSRRFMSLTNDKKANQKNNRMDDGPAPPKPPRNYDSLPRGFKTSNGETRYDVVSSGIRPFSSGHSPKSRTEGGSQCSSSSSPQQNYFVVVAIDFGTTYSGYAFSFTQDSDNIHMMRKWEGGDHGVQNQKTPTTLLLDPDEKFHSFGYAARDCYHDLDQDEAKKWLFFEKFKMTLHKTENLSNDTVIHAANGKGVSALVVFGHALRYFKDHALQELSDQSATDILNDDVRWVVTVPAIWRQPAKQFMRKASYEAGIASKENPEQLLIALEPEAASIFCRRLRLYQLVPPVISPQRLSLPNIKEPADGYLEPAVLENAGTRYIVVDCGGGTVDITVHEIIDEHGTIKELHKATGGPYGSVGIDLEFEKLLEDIFGADFIHQFRVKRPVGWVELMAAFEARKRNASPFKITPINISLPYSFIEYYKKMKNNTVGSAVKKFSSKEIKWSSQGMLRLEPSGMADLFHSTLEAIRRHVSHVLEHCDAGDISYLFLVGGFAESAILQKSIRDAFSDRLKVIIPQGMGLAILKGAVQFGIDPTVVSSRRSRLTYGVGVLNRFINGTHPADKLVVKDGVEWCADVFDKFVLADQSLCIGDTVIRRYTPARTGQACSVIHIYCSEREDALFITDSGVKRCGTLVLDLPDEPQVQVADPKKREIQTIMIFGDTELKVSAMDVLTGKCVKAEVDFLNG